MYREADVYLFDDPLSAVDAHVGRHIMDFILSWLKSKTVVMPCHQLHFLHHADLIVSLEDAVIQEQGSFSELMSSGGPFAELMRAHGATGSPRAPGDDQQEHPLGLTPRSDVNVQTDEEVLVALRGAGNAGGLIEDEDRKTGKISKEVYGFYLAQFSWAQLGPLVAFFALSQLCVFSMDVFLSRWAVEDTSLLLVHADDPTLVYCSTYALLGISTFVFSGSRYVWCQLIGLKASNKMHNLMLNNLVHAPVSFFDVTPIGRIVNRFSGDIANLDVSTPVQYHQLIVVTLQLLNSLVVVAVMLPVFFIWLVPMAYINNALTTKYRICGRELKRLASNSRSPMFQHFNETINGL